MSENESPLTEEEAALYAADLFDELLPDVEVVGEMYASTVMLMMDVSVTDMLASEKEAFDLGIRAGLTGTLHVLAAKEMLVIDFNKET